MKNSDLLSYIDFNGVKVFESATVDTSVMEFKKSNDNSDFIYCDIDRDYEINMNLDNYIDKNGFEYKKADLDIEGFSFANPKELKIKKRIEEIGTPLKDWDIQIYRGVLTGFNEAFIIDGEIKDELIAKDPKCAEIIKPLLRGRDIKRYKYDFADKWLINSHNGYKNKPRIDVEKDYPVIKEWLDNFKEQIEKRYDKGETAYNLRNCAYVGEFEKEKIVYPETTQYPDVFVYDKHKFFIDKTGFFLIGNKLKYINSILNSKLYNFYFRQVIRLVGAGFQLSKVFLDEIHIVNIDTTKPFETLVDYIIYLKENAEKYQNTDLFSADKLFERIIDFMVYGLYFENEMKVDGTYINNEVAPILFSVSPLQWETKVQDIGQEKEHKNEAKKSPHYQGGDLEGGLEQQIRTVYNAFKNNKLIMKALTFCNVEEVKIIEESIKTNSNEVDMEIDENED